MLRDESEAWCITFHMKVSFYSHANKYNFPRCYYKIAVRWYENSLVRRLVITLRMEYLKDFDS